MKKPTAKQIAARKLFAARSKAGTLKKRVRKNPRGRSRGGIARPSQTRPHKKPTARLIRRRRKTLRAPKGYYANPRVLRFAVLCDGRRIAHFEKRTHAFEYARAFHRKYPYKRVSVESV